MPDPSFSLYLLNFNFNFWRLGGAAHLSVVLGLRGPILYEQLVYLITFALKFITFSVMVCRKWRSNSWISF